MPEHEGEPPPDIEGASKTEQTPEPAPGPLPPRPQPEFLTPEQIAKKAAQDAADLKAQRQQMRLPEPEVSLEERQAQILEKLNETRRAIFEGTGNEEKLNARLEQLQNELMQVNRQIAGEPESTEEGLESAPILPEEDQEAITRHQLETGAGPEEEEDEEEPNVVHGEESPHESLPEAGGPPESGGSRPPPLPEGGKPSRWERITEIFRKSPEKAATGVAIALGGPAAILGAGGRERGPTPSAGGGGTRAGGTEKPGFFDKYPWPGLAGWAWKGIMWFPKKILQLGTSIMTLIETGKWRGVDWGPLTDINETRKKMFKKDEQK